MNESIQKKINNLRIKLYSGQNSEEIENELAIIEHELTFLFMNIEKLIETWETKHSLLLDEYSKGNKDNDIMRMYRTHMKDILAFIDILKQVKNTYKFDNINICY